MNNADLQAQITRHFARCRRRVPQFVAAHYSVPGAIRINRLAWGTDVCIAPVNVFLGIPNFVLQLTAVVLGLLGAKRLANWFRRRCLGFPTAVQKKIRTELISQLLELPAAGDAGTDKLRRVIARAAQEPVSIYLHTRNVAADITAGTLAAAAGLVFFSQFTPGSISAGSTLSRIIAKEQAVSDFWLGETLGRWYYDTFPVEPSSTVVIASLLATMTVLAVVSAFSGFIHDPFQKVTGIHRRRLNKLLDAIEEAAKRSSGDGYRPKDAFFGRVYDVVDWIKALLAF